MVGWQRWVFVGCVCFRSFRCCSVRIESILRTPYNTRYSALLELCMKGKKRKDARTQELSQACSLRLLRRRGRRDGAASGSGFDIILPPQTACFIHDAPALPANASILQLFQAWFQHQGFSMEYQIAPLQILSDCIWPCACYCLVSRVLVSR